MNEVGKEYGTALYLLACEKNCTEKYLHELHQLSQMFSEEQEYKAFLLSPNVPMQKRLASLGEVCGAFVSADVTSFVQLLCEKGRFSHFEEARAAYRALFENAAHIMKVKIRSAVALTEEEKQRLQAKLETVYKAKVDITYAIDPDLIGGVVMETEDKITDGSIRHHLQEVKEVMSK